MYRLENYNTYRPIVLTIYEWKHLLCEYHELCLFHIVSNGKCIAIPVSHERWSTIPHADLFTKHWIIWCHICKCELYPNYNLEKEILQQYFRVFVCRNFLNVSLKRQAHLLMGILAFFHSSQPALAWTLWVLSTAEWHFMLWSSIPLQEAPFPTWPQLAPHSISSRSLKVWNWLKLLFEILTKINRPLI